MDLRCPINLGSGLKIRVGRVSGNTQFVFRPKFYFYFDKLAMTVWPSRNEDECHVPSSLKNIAYLSFSNVRNHIAAEGLFMFYRTKL